VTSTSLGKPILVPPNQDPVPPLAALAHVIWRHDRCRPSEHGVRKWDHPPWVVVVAVVEELALLSHRLFQAWVVIHRVLLVVAP